MAHYSKVRDGIVTEVIVAEPEFFNNFLDSTPGEWIQTSYNTRGGVHSEGGMPLRKNFGGIGYIYDKTRDAFYAPQPYPSWTLNEETCLWEAPVEKPDNGNMHIWNETDQQWDEVT